MKILVTGASGNAGQAICKLLHESGYQLRMADVAPPAGNGLHWGEFVRCDSRTFEDVRRAVEGMDAVVHLAAWHCAHEPPVSDATIFAVNVDGTFNLFEACRAAGIGSIVYASSMAYGWGTVYSLTKVVGEEMCRAYQEMTGAAIAVLRYHAFTPAPYLEYGARMLRNGVDRRDVASATLSALNAVIERRFTLFNTIVHSLQEMPKPVLQDFRTNGPAWCEIKLPGSATLLAKYSISLPEQVEQHDLSDAEKVLGWKPSVNFLTFLSDLQRRDKRGEDVSKLFTTGELPAS